MNNSIKYIKHRITNTPETLLDMHIEGWDTSLIINPIEKFKQYIPAFSRLIKDNEFKIVHQVRSEKINVNIKYDDTFTDFDYFTTERITHDGTLCFVEEAIQKLLFKLMYLQTSYTNKTHDDFFNNPHKYNIEYIIGDVIIHRDFGMKNINGMEIFGETNIMVLPIKFDILKLK